MRKLSVLILSASLSLLITGAFLLVAQEKPEARTYEGELVKNWNSVQNKILEMARDFPEEKFDYRPHPDTRSFIEEIWHVTAMAESVAIICHGDQPNFKEIFSDEGRPRDRTGLVAALEKANQDSAAGLEENPTPRIIGWLRGSGEHYGKLVGHYRENGLVPPSSRK